jgi:5-methylcytosine-specific restriction protein A
VATISETVRLRGRPWERKRQQILTRDAGMCQCDECKQLGRVLPATEVDHRIPLWEGGTDDDENLQAINEDCHKRKTASEAGRRR